MVRNLNRFFSDHLTMEGDTTHTYYGADQYEFCDKKCHLRRISNLKPIFQAHRFSSGIRNHRFFAI